MPASSLPVEHLFHMTLKTEGDPAIIPAGPQGTRMLVGVGGGSFEGPKLKGEVVPPGGDWVTQRNDGSILLDVRVTLRTDDGALIYMWYYGIGLVEEDGNFKARSAPYFETSDERYAWLNNVQGIGIGGVEDGDVVYEVYALL